MEIDLEPRRILTSTRFLVTQSIKKSYNGVSFFTSGLVCLESHSDRACRMASVPTAASAAAARFAIPAVPPRIHRHLRVAARDDGLLFTADGGDRDHSVLIRWGIQAKVEPVVGHPFVGLEIGCILGIIRLWDGERVITRSN